MELSSFEVKSASAGDLKAMISMCERELEIRNVARRDELIQAVCDAMNQLYKEFPMVGLRMEYKCSECAIEDYVDMMEYFCGGKQMSPNDFYTW